MSEDIVEESFRSVTDAVEREAAAAKVELQAKVKKAQEKALAQLKSQDTPS